MNEYCRGALEALGWVLELLDAAEEKGDGQAIEEVRQQVKAMIEELVRGSGSSLPTRLGVIPHARRR